MHEIGNVTHLPITILRHVVLGVDETVHTILSAAAPLANGNTDGR
jgi:hypothetical protein